MKDPLATSETPYEILGVDHSAGPKEIHKAFQAGLVRRIQPQKLLRAKQVLERPVERGLLDLFHYDGEFLDLVHPQPGTEPSALEIPNRAETAQAWETILRGRFPESGVNHNLAVLWYWWALFESDRLLEEAGAEPSCPNLGIEELWKAAIGCWAMVWADRSFWNRQSVVPESAVEEVRSGCLNRITTELQRYTQRHREAESNEWVKLYSALEHAMATEVKTAKAVADAGLQNEYGMLACGTIQLQRFGQLAALRKEVQGAFSQWPGNEGLRELAQALSPFSNIAARLEQKQYQEALEDITALSKDSQDSDEVRGFKATALLELGRQQESLGHLPEALAFWKKAISAKPSAALTDQVRQTVEERCLAGAASLQKKKRNEAIKLLEQALEFVDSEQMKETLAEMLAAKGIDTINKVQKESDTDSLEGIKKLQRGLKRGLKELEKAAELGSERAKEQVVTARELVAKVDGIRPVPEGMTDEVHALMEKAQKAHSEDILALAMAHLQEALEKVPGGSEAETLVKRNLSAVMTGIGVQFANSAVEKVNGTSVSRDQLDEAKGFLAGAKAALEEAQSLDPENKQAKQSQQQVNKLLVDLNSMSTRQVYQPGSPYPLIDYSKILTPGPDERRLWHTFLSLLFLPVPLGVWALSTPGPKWFLKGVSDWVRAVGAGNVVGNLSIALGGVVSLVTLVLLVFSYRTKSDFGEQLLSKKWSVKSPFSKVVEVAHYGFYLSFLTALFLRPGPMPTVELPPPFETTAEAQPERVAPPVPDVGSSSTTRLPSSPTPVAGGADLDWMTQGAVPPPVVTAWLTHLAEPTDEESGWDIEGVRSVMESATPEGREAAYFLLGWAAESTGNEQEAREVYHGLLSFAEDTPYGRSAQLRLDLMDSEDASDLEEVYETLSEDSGTWIWAQVDGAWTFMEVRELGLSGLMAGRANQWFIRWVSMIRKESFVPVHYDYLFILFTLSCLLIILQLPLVVANGIELAKLLNARRKRGINPLPGRITLVLGTGLALALFFLFRDYEPQLALDQARFFWVENVVERNLGIHLIWFVIGVFLMYRTPLDKGTGTAKTYLVRGVLWCGPIAVITWFWGWPAWAMLFWAMLWFLTAMVQTFVAALHVQR